MINIRLGYKGYLIPSKKVSTCILPYAHKTHWPVCQKKAIPYLDGLNTQNPRFYQSFVQLDAPHEDDQAMELIWQQVDDLLAAFEEPESCAGEALSIDWKQRHCLDSEMMDTVYMRQNHLDDKISHQLSTNALVEAFKIVACYWCSKLCLPLCDGYFC
jgi:hypothetical protein